MIQGCGLETNDAELDITAKAGKRSRYEEK